VKLNAHYLPMLRSRMRGATSPPQYVFMTWYLVKHRDFTLTFTRVYNMRACGAFTETECMIMKIVDHCFEK
jgi:hypothetical protein